MDDAYTGLRYVANLLAGRGFVFNPGERVEGVTNAGWLLLLAPVARLLGPVGAVKALALAAMAATLALTWAAARPLAVAGAGPSWLPAAALLLAATHAEWAAFSLLGMETAALSVVLTAFVGLAGQPRGLAGKPRGLAGRGARPLLGPGLGVLAFLLHPEAGLIYPLGLAIAWRTGALARREAWRGAAVWLAGLVAVELARLAYFGSLLPNTFLAKPGGALAAASRLPELAAGGLTNIGSPFAGLFALAALALGWGAWRGAAPRPAAFAAAACLIGLAFSLYARPDWTERGRYFAPYAPVAGILLLAGLVRAERAIVRGGPEARLVRTAALALELGLVAITLGALVLLASGSVEASGLHPYLWIGLAGLWLAAVEVGRRLPRPWRDAGLATLAVALAAGLWGGAATVRLAAGRERLAFPGYVMTTATLVAPARWLGEHLPAGATIATRRIGAVSFYADRRVFDYSFGLTEPEVARRIRQRGGENFATPAALELADLWRERAPGYLLEDGELLREIAAEAGGTPANFSLQGLDYGEVRRFAIAPGVDWVLAARREARAAAANR